MTPSRTRRGPARRPSAATSRQRRRGLTAFAVAVGLIAATAVAVTSASSSTGGDEAVVAFDRESGVLDFRAPTFAGGVVDSAELRGTPVVLNFYASWCTVCDRELPDFQRVSEQLAGSVQVIGVNPQSNDTDSAQAAMIERNGVTYPTVRDARDELLRPFNPTGGLPTTVFLSADGVVRKVHNGLLTEQLLLDEIEASLGVPV